MTPAEIDRLAYDLARIATASNPNGLKAAFVARIREAVGQDETK